MDRNKKDKLFLEWRDEEVHTTKWFSHHKISPQLTYRYVQSGLIKKLGGGAYVKTSDNLNWQAALFTAQKELNLPLHVAGQNVFQLLGESHFIPLSERSKVLVILRKKARVPIWLKQNDWGVDFKFKLSTLFENEKLGLETFKRSQFPLQISSRERAVMEMIDYLDLSESFEDLESTFESLSNIRSKLTQQLLETCTSLKVKRVFLYIATKLELPVLKKLDLKKIDLGKGKRVIVKGGKFNETFGITVPRDYATEGETV